MTDPGVTPHWMRRLLDGIVRSGELELCGLVAPVAPPPAAPVHPFYRIWNRIEARVAARPPEREFPALANALAGLPAYGPGDERELAALGLDVVLDLSGNCGRTLGAQLANEGVWFPDCVGPHAGTAGLDAIIARAPSSSLALLRKVAGKGSPELIAKGELNTKFIAARHELYAQEKSVPLILRELRRAHRGGIVAMEGEPRSASPAPPDLTRTYHYLRRMLGEAGSRSVDGLRARCGQRPGMFSLNTVSADVLDFDPAQAMPWILPGNRYQADPFLWEHLGRTYCFFETYDYDTHKGSISVGELADQGLINVRTALSTDCHLSFPFLFEHEGQLFMMPESCGNKRLEIWRCTQFPDHWELHSTALEGCVAADSHLASIGEDWWLFTNISDDPFGDMSSELHLFRVDGPDLANPIPHPLNPVVFGSRTARNAGRLIERGGIFYRPSQDNSHGVYGYGLNIMRIDHISLEDYSETLVRRIEPDFREGIIGCHHVDTRGDLVVFDTRMARGGRG
ncbi:MAG TPA: hypothetical protein VJQ77_09660 [Novosphingobium sp.]|nr:hypothetical protein [Novosphingobium sp.]